MSSGGGSQTVRQTTDVPSYVRDAQQNLLSAANRFTSPFLQNAPQQTVAGFTPDQEMAFDATRGMAADAFTNGSPLSVASQLGNVYMPYHETPSPSQVSPTSYNAASAGPAAQAAIASAGPAALAQAASAGPAALAQAASAGQASLSDPRLGQVAGNNIRELLNPYTKDVLDPTIAAMRRELGQTQAQIGARNASSAAFGGSRGALQSAEANRAFGDQVALTTAQLMSRGYDQATATALANASQAQQAGEFNAGQQNDMGRYNAGLQQQVGLHNSDALNQMGQFNAGLRQQTGLYNAGAQNAQSQFNAGQANQVGMYNTGQANQTGQFNANLAQQAAAANAAAANTMGMFNSGNNIAAARYNTDTANKSIQQGAAVSESDAARTMQRQMQALQALLGTGGLQQQIAQQSINAPIDMFKLFQSATPGAYGSTGSTTTPTYTNPLGAAAGAVGLGNSLFGSSGMFPGALSGMFGGGGSALPESMMGALGGDFGGGGELGVAASEFLPFLLGL